MPSFRSKNSKKYKESKFTPVTLDGKHQEIVSELQRQMQCIVPVLKLEKRNLVKELPHGTLEEQLEMRDRITQIDQEIRDIRQRHRQYYIDNARYIFEYFELKKKISDGVATATPVMTSSKTQVIHDLFKIKPPETNTNTSSTNDTSLNVDHMERMSCNVIQKYLANVNDSTMDMSQYMYRADQCGYCRVGEMVNLEDEGMSVCNNCSRCVPCLTENEKPSYKEQPKEVSFYAYRRINHFKEILTQFQGKEMTQIPDELMHQIVYQIRKERLELGELTNDTMRDILRKLNYSKFYEHVPFIKDKLGIKPPTLRPGLEETLLNLFVEVQCPYCKYCPDNRINFLNYYYTAYKLCQLLGETQYLSQFPLLKDRDKLIEQDVIWRNICCELDWEFIPTV